jgi:uncharacterized protein
MAQNNNTRKKKNQQRETVEELVQCLALIPHPEGGYFRETFRSGSIPMSTRGCTDLAVPARDMVLVRRKGEEGAVVVGGVDTAGHADNDDNMVRRNCLTSIFWVPTVDSPKLFMSQNRSDHVHYYQGGAPFEYIVFRPSKENDDEGGRWTRTILGPDLQRGQVLQLPVEGGCYKCGRLLSSSSSSLDQQEGDDIDDNDYPPYSIIAEAVAPGFDVHDFHWVTAAQLAAATGGGRDDDVVAMSTLQEYLKEFSGVILEEGKNGGSSAADHFDPFYDALPPPQR